VFIICFFFISSQATLLLAFSEFVSKDACPPNSLTSAGQPSGLPCLDLDRNPSCRSSTSSKIVLQGHLQHYTNSGVFIISEWGRQSPFFPSLPPLPFPSLSLNRSPPPKSSSTNRIWCILPQNLTSACWQQL